MITIKDVAKRTGISVNTVSRVLNNRGYISNKTRLKVCEAVKELDYHPNELARALSRRKSNLIGLIIPSVSHPFYASIASYIELHAYDYGYKILLCNACEDSRKEKEYIEMLKRNQVDGIIMGSHTLEISEYLNLNFPVVAIDRHLSDDIPFITSDNYFGGLLATNLLIDNGCQKLAHISGSLELTSTTNKRYQAFIDAAAERNVEHVVVETKLNNFGKDEYEKVIYKLFNDHPDIDGIFASSDIVAASIIDICSELGKKIPNELKVVGFDDVIISSLTVPSITTIRQPVEKIAESAVKAIIDLIEGKKIKHENILNVELVRRETA